MSAIVPGAGESGAGPEELAQALAQARQEAATLHGVLNAITDALAAAMMPRVHGSTPVVAPNGLPQRCLDLLCLGACALGVGAAPSLVVHCRQRFQGPGAVRAQIGTVVVLECLLQGLFRVIEVTPPGV